MSGGAKAGIGGIGGVILIALVTFLGGGDIGDVFNAVQQNAAQQTATQGEYTPSAEEEELASFSKKMYGQRYSSRAVAPISRQSSCCLPMQ